jgi:cupin fold WbuC family metalloprotein
MELKKLSAEAYQSNETIPFFSFDQHLPFLIEARKDSTRGRTRILMHPNSASKLHEMYVLYGKQTFIRANMHIDKDESVYVLEGIVDVVLFENAGNISEVVRLEANSASVGSFIILPANQYHTVIIRSEIALLFESTPGPFNPAVTVYADWSPLEDDLNSQRLFLEEVDEFRRKQASISSRVSEIDTILQRESQKVFRLQNQQYVGKSELSFLTRTLVSEELDRVRVCIHRDDTSELQEMFMVFSNNTFVNPSLHSDKDESLFVVEGLATYVFFDSQGEVIHRIPLGSPDNKLGRATYCRIPAGVIHSLVVESEVVIVKETTSGPFVKSGTHFPDWSPSPNKLIDIRAANALFLGVPISQ